MVYRQKQVFVGAVRDLSISLTGRFGDEGRRLRSDVDALEAALRGWDQSIAAFETAPQGGPRWTPMRRRPWARSTWTATACRTPLRAFDAAAKLAPRRADVHQFAAMVHGLAGPPRRGPAGAAAGPGHPARRRRHQVRDRALHDGSWARPSPAATVFTSFHQAALKQLSGPQHVEAPFSRPGLLRQTAGVAPLFPPAPYVAGLRAPDEGPIRGGHRGVPEGARGRSAAGTVEPAPIDCSQGAPRYAPATCRARCDTCPRRSPPTRTGRKRTGSWASPRAWTNSSNRAWPPSRRRFGCSRPTSAPGWAWPTC